MAARSRRRRGGHEEAHGSHERWLITYADMITLLMVLFIVMFAISQVDQRKFNQLKDGMAAGFGESSSPFQGTDGAMTAEGMAALTPIRPQDPSGFKPSDSTQTQSVSTQGSRVPAQVAQDYADAKDEVERLEDLERRIAAILRRHGLRQDVQFRIDERGLSISLVSRHIVFQANVADLSARGKKVLAVLAPVLRALPNQVDVDGHTNQVKVKPKYYPTDWELSAARAVTVLRYLAEHGRVPQSRMVAVAFGHEKPLRDPALPGAAALNKRVDLVVVSGASEGARKLFTKVIADRSGGAPHNGSDG
ncbi:MAG: flagellar motor protein MotB [Nocardioidaceae bacterium]|nr:flagellar motor protein MotB [Nocardioidaceae bacterium]